MEYFRVHSRPPQFNRNALERKPKAPFLGLFYLFYLGDKIKIPLNIYHEKREHYKIT